MGRPARSPRPSGHSVPVRRWWSLSESVSTRNPCGVGAQLPPRPVRSRTAPFGTGFRVMRSRRTNLMRMESARPRRTRSMPIGPTLGLMGFAVLFGTLSAAAGPAPGTSIDNFAVANAVDSVSRPVTLSSDTVRVVVQPWASLTLSPGRTIFARAGNSTALAHRLRNSGNVTLDARLDLGNLAGDDYDLAGLALFQDLNANGAVDPGDPALAPGSTVTLAPGDSLDLVLAATVPGSTPALARAWLELTATATGAVAAATDTVEALTTLGPPALAFFTDASYGVATTSGAAGQPLFVQASAVSCDLDSSAVDTISITLTSQRTGDSQGFRAIESAPATGRFRIVPDVPTVLSAGSGSIPGVLSVALNDEVV